MRMIPPAGRVCLPGRRGWGLAPEPENQSNLNKNALWKHWLFLCRFLGARAFFFKLSDPTRGRAPGPHPAAPARRPRA